MLKIALNFCAALCLLGATSLMAEGTDQDPLPGVAARVGKCRTYTSEASRLFLDDLLKNGSSREGLSLKRYLSGINTEALLNNIPLPQSGKLELITKDNMSDKSDSSMVSDGKQCCYRYAPANAPIALFDKDKKCDNKTRVCFCTYARGF